MHLICGVRKDGRKYVYKGDSLNANELQRVLKNEGHEKRCRKRNTRYFEVVVDYEGIGQVKLYFCRVNAYDSLDGLFAEIKNDLIENNVAERLWALFDDLLQVGITSIAKSGLVDILEFRNSFEYEYLKELFDNSFLSNQLKVLEKAS
jgi:hypothetical protein